jgi:hypothetical protein
MGVVNGPSRLTDRTVMTWLYQREGRTFELEALQNASTGQYLLVWRYPSGRRHMESFPGSDVYRACLRLVTQHLELMGWQCRPKGTELTEATV